MSFFLLTINSQLTLNSNPFSFSHFLILSFSQRAPASFFFLLVPDKESNLVGLITYYLVFVTTFYLVKVGNSFEGEN